MSTHQYSRSSILILGSRKPKIALISNTSCSASTAGRSSDSSSESSSWPTNGSSDGSALSRSSASSASSSEKRTPAVADERAPTEAWEPLRAEGSDRIMPSCAACRKEVGKSVSSPNDPRPEPPRPQWPPSAPWPWPWPGPWPSPWPSPPGSTAPPSPPGPATDDRVPGRRRRRRRHRRRHHRRRDQGPRRFVSARAWSRFRVLGLGTASCSRCALARTWALCPSRGGSWSRLRILGLGAAAGNRCALPRSSALDPSRGGSSRTKSSSSRLEACGARAGVLGELFALAFAAFLDSSGIRMGPQSLKASGKRSFRCSNQTSQSSDPTSGSLHQQGAHHQRRPWVFGPFHPSHVMALHL
mmetsp:Transcript_28873/g.81033  ORF Transcript_28873/g.81033 Transcript_28873/m.81033 type:complete len:357 (-) Transcript_28873:510-1580(-)